jgi:hypothetical protein
VTDAFLEEAEHAFVAAQSDVEGENKQYPFATAVSVCSGVEAVKALVDMKYSTT